MSKNTHLEHLEDDIFNNGYAGAQNALAFLEGLKGMLTTGSGGGQHEGHSEVGRCSCHHLW